MKINRLLLLALLVMCLSGVALGQTQGVERRGYLNGAVQSLQIEKGSLIILHGVGDSRPRLNNDRNQHADYTFDEKGNLLDAIRYENKNVSQREVFRYDDKGRVVEELRFESNDTPVERSTHRYNSDGRRIESLQYDQRAKQISKIVYAYDADGRLTEKTSYKDEKPDCRAVFAYDAKGRETSFIAYDAKGDIPNQIVSVYDDKANAVQRARSNLKGDLEGTTVTTYDSKGNVLTILHHRPDGNAVWKWEFEYNGRGNVIKEQFANKESLSVWVYEYEYDSMGNWTKKTRSQLFDDRGKLKPYLSEVTFRTFKYHAKPSPVQAIIEPEDFAIVRDAVLALAASEIRPIKAGALAATNTTESLGRPMNSGTLQIEMTIDAEGRVGTAKVISGREVFSGKTADVERNIMKRTYKPVLLNGVPVKVITTMKVEYTVARR
jgi:antitoxin component YwqK of YwqJK toxin-antitoxin module